MDVLSQLYHAAILDEDGDLVGRVDSIHLLGGRMVVMLKTIEAIDGIEQPDPGSDEAVDPEDIEVTDGASADVDKVMHLVKETGHA